MNQRPQPLSWVDDELEQLDRANLRRRLLTHAGPQGPIIEVDGRRLVNFGSNDYLALAADPRLADAAAKATGREGWGAGASPLVTGHASAHHQLELALAEFEGTQAALLFSSGFAANIGAIAALAERGDAVFSDQKNHASIVDGCRLSRADVHIYPHRDWRRLEELLREAGGYRRRLIATDTLFSMDGDLAPLVELAELAERYDCMLLVDEAHATGIFGERGRGVAEHLDVEDRVHVRIGTLSKALGSAGGFVAGSQSLIDWLANRARPYVFSTAQPGASAAAAAAALEIINTEPERRRVLLASAEYLRQQLRQQGWNCGASVSQIIPVLVGAPEATMYLADALRQRGFWTPGIRPPSVPEGESLLRISLSYGHTREMLDGLIEVMRDLRPA